MVLWTPTISAIWTALGKYEVTASAVKVTASAVEQPAGQVNYKVLSNTSPRLKVPALVANDGGRVSLLMNPLIIK